jgi:hypothetical protein
MINEKLFQNVSAVSENGTYEPRMNPHEAGFKIRVIRVTLLRNSA